VDTFRELKDKENEFMSSKTHRRFTAEQKSEYVRLATQLGKPISQVANELNLTESALRKWIKQAQVDEEAASDGPLTTEERQELTRLRREVKRLEQERPCLKKAAAFLRQGVGRLCRLEATAVAQETLIPMS
jgi:transposase